MRVLIELGDVDALGDVSCQGLLQLKREINMGDMKDV
jgi:hypothetical protein